MKKLLASMAVAAVLAPASAFAEDVPFTATVASTCGIVVNTAGTLGPNGDASVLSSANGTAAAATVTANALNFTLSVGAPSGWVTSPTGTPTTSFDAAMTFGGTTYSTSDTPSVPATATPVSVDMSATAASGSFPNGSYSTNATLTCSS
ncbi:MAG: hypothetical protein AAFP80_03415 [Pseudomonadota bacterium]